MRKEVIQGCDRRTPLMTRWVLYECRFGKLMLHHFHRSDEDREMHDHPWPFVSLICRGGYMEETERGKRWKQPGSLLFRPARWRHRVVLPPRRTCWTLVLAGPRCREWGFWSDEGWVPWRAFMRGKGCD